MAEQRDDARLLEIVDALKRGAALSSGTLFHFSHHILDFEWRLMARQVLSLPPSAAPSQPQTDQNDPAASPVTPDAEAIAASWKIAERVANDWCANDNYRSELLAEIEAALTAYAMWEREAATIRAIEFVEGGRFLHDDAPPKRFAMECAGEMRKQLLGPIRARSAQSKEGK